MSQVPMRTLALAVAVLRLPVSGGCHAPMSLPRSRPRPPSPWAIARSTPARARPGPTRSPARGPILVNIASVGLTGADAGTVHAAAGRARRGPSLTQTQTCTAIVAFAPTATGARSTTLSIVTNGPTLTSAAITGTGRDLGDRPRVRCRSPARSAAGAGAAQTRDDHQRGHGRVHARGGDRARRSSSRARTRAPSAALAPAASCTVAVSFAPTSPGPRAGTLAIASFGPAPVADHRRGAAGRDVALACRRATSPMRAVGVASEPQVFTLTNTGAGPLPVGAVSLGGDASSFSIVRDDCSGEDARGTGDVRGGGRVRAGRGRLPPRSSLRLDSSASPGSRAAGAVTASTRC